VSRHIAGTVSWDTYNRLRIGRVWGIKETGPCYGTGQSVPATAPAQTLVQWGLQGGSQVAISGGSLYADGHSIPARRTQALALHKQEEAARNRQAVAGRHKPFAV
jgi:hypothetical protein